MKVYRIRVEPTERGERYTLPCGNCGFQATYDRLVLERPGREDVIERPEGEAGANEAMSPQWVDFVERQVEAEHAALVPPAKPARRKPAPKPKAKPATKARRRR